MIKDNLRILYVHRTQGKWVEAVHIKGIVEALQKLGHNVLLTSPINVDEEEKKNSWINSTIAWLSSHLPELLFEIGEILYNLVIIIKIFKMNSNKNFAFIYERYAFFNFSGILAAKILRIPFFLEVNYLTTTPLVRKKTRVFRPLSSYIEKKVLQNADGLFVISDYVKSECLKYDINLAKLIYTPNAIDPKSIKYHIEPDKLKKKFGFNDDIIIGFVGGFFKWHGLEFMIDSIINIPNTFDKYRLLLIGDGPEKNKIKDLVQELGIENITEFTGNINHEMIWTYLNLVDIAVLPHSNEYGSPVKIFEYMAMGCAVLAPRVGPVEEIIKDGECGLLFKISDNDDFVLKMKILLKNEKLRTKLGEKAKDEVHRKYTWENNALKILNAYDQCAEKN